MGFWALWLDGFESGLAIQSYGFQLGCRILGFGV